ncbi:MAG TPA: hypothetical protein VIM02_13355 [Rhizomicrobium sp.]|jgi:hypothetical protein
MPVSSPTFSTAFLAVAVHVPEEHDTFCVGLEEIAKSALAADDAQIIAATTAAIVRIRLAAIALSRWNSNNAAV